MARDEPSPETFFPKALPIEDAHNAYFPELVEQRIKDSEQDRKERKRYSSLFFRLVSGWLAAVLFMVALDGVQLLSFDLGEPVLLALLGSTTGTVFSVLIFVAKYLFPS
ncbi:MAG: hypothetical protein OXD50_00150 [Chloroflexi bacterium]|nr:hypothetical protein [Chloroflexota bacterium]